MDFSTLPLLPAFLLLAALVLALWDRFSIPASTPFERDTAYNNMVANRDEVQVDERRLAPDYVDSRVVGQRTATASAY